MNDAKERVRGLRQVIHMGTLVTAVVDPKAMVAKRRAATVGIVCVTDGQ